MRTWVRWQDWVAVLAGAFAALSTIWINLTGEGAALATMITLGALIVLSALVALARPGLVATEWLSAIFGVLLFVAPFAMGFTSLAGAAWTCWIAGVVATAAALAAVPASNQAHREITQH